MAQSAEKRNEQIYKLLNQLLKEGTGKINLTPLSNEVESLFSTHIWGHREIVLTILIASLINPKYKASEDFYACNPRSIYEKPIRTFFRKYGIPHKKSGPLNVAKNILKINKDWAANKRGDDVAISVVKIVKTIEKMSSQTLKKFTASYITRYLQEATRIKKMSYTPAINNDPVHLANLCQSLITEVPDGGATPQIIIGLLIEVDNKDKRSSSEVSGHLDSVSTTNTTSKKAGDIIESLSSGNFVYEITVKKFDSDRLRESYESLRADKSMKDVNEVFVICRPTDVHPKINALKSEVVMGVYIFQDVAYYFVDIFEWIRLKILFMTIPGRSQFHSTLAKYVNSTNTSEKVKKYFKKWYKKY